MLRPLGKIDPSQWILGWFALAAGFVDLCLFIYLVNHPLRSIAYSLELVGGLILSQTVLLAAMLTWGRHSLPLRVIVAGIGVGALSCLGATTGTDPRMTVRYFFGLFSIYFGLALIPMVMARLSGLGLENRRVKQPTGIEASTARRPGWKGKSPKQFTLWGLLTLMTLAGIGTAIARVVEFPIGEYVPAAGYVATLILTSLLVLSLVLFRVPLILIAVVGLNLVVPTAWYVVQNSTYDVGVMLASNGVFSFIAAIIFRVAGLRLVWRNAKTK